MDGTKTSKPKLSIPYHQMNKVN